LIDTTGSRVFSACSAVYHSTRCVLSCILLLFSSSFIILLTQLLTLVDCIAEYSPEQSAVAYSRRNDRSIPFYTYLFYTYQGSHAAWKVVEFKKGVFAGLESHGNDCDRGKVMEFHQ